jgi:DNA-binding transcriptional ArsR family regulator
MAMATAKMKKATTSALAVNESLLRTKKTFQQAANLLKQVSDPTRLQVITLLSEHEHNVGGLCDKLNICQPALSHHLALLRHGGIVERRRLGQNNFYTLTDTGDRLSKIAKGVIGWTAPKTGTDRPGESEESGVSDFSPEIRFDDAQLRMTTKVEAHIFLAVQEVRSLSHFFLYSN